MGARCVRSRSTVSLACLAPFVRQRKIENDQQDRKERKTVGQARVIECEIRRLPGSHGPESNAERDIWCCDSYSAVVLMYPDKCNDAAHAGNAVSVRWQRQRTSDVRLLS